LIWDWTDISLNPFRKRDLENIPYKWGYSTKGYLLEKMMILIDYESLTSILIHVYPVNVHESKIYLSILEMLKRKRLIRYGDVIIMDKGFCSYKNYLIDRYGTVPLIIPKKNLNLEKLKTMINYPLTFLKTLKN